MKPIFIILFLLTLCPYSFAEEGLASYYTIKSSGTITASGERYNEDSLTCASMDYKLGTLLKITNVENNKSVIVKVNDKGGFKKYGRIIDLTPKAFLSIADLKEGIVTVKIEVIK